MVDDVTISVPVHGTTVESVECRDRFSVPVRERGTQAGTYTNQTNLENNQFDVVFIPFHRNEGLFFVRFMIK